LTAEDRRLLWKYYGFIGYNMQKELVGLIESHKEKAINEFCDTLRAQLNTNLVEIRLFGSTARGTFTDESDIDILVVVQNENGLTREAVIDMAVDINLKHDVVISPIVMSKNRYTEPLFQETLFYKSIQEEGMPL
jgi:predicted nucleotidyltransferase